MRINAIADTKETRLNDQISARVVRLIGADGDQVGVVPLNEALLAAEAEGLDLVEISPNAEPPVCRVMDYGKYLYTASKQRQIARKNQKQIIVKEVKFRPGTDKGDYTIKLNKLVQFIGDGNKVKITLRFRGREMAHQELGLEMLERIEHDLTEVAVVEQRPLREGRQMVMVMAPKR